MSETQKPNQGNREGGNRRPRNNNNRNRNNRNRNRQRTRAPKPLKLTFWQKVLKSVGLFNEEKARKQQQSKRPQQQQDTKKTAPKSNVRNAKTSKNSQFPDDNKEPRRRAPQKVSVDSARLYVGNLSYEATEHDLEELFKGVGTVKKVEIIYNRNTHKSKGYGFIQMLNTEEAERAVDVLHDQPFLGRQLVVNGSKSRKEGDTSAETQETETAAAE